MILLRVTFNIKVDDVLQKDTTQYNIYLKELIKTTRRLVF